MCCGNGELSGIMTSMFRGAGTCVGTVAAAGKKITCVVTSGVKSVGHLLVRPVDTPELIAAEQTKSRSEGFVPVAREQEESSAKSVISSLESDLAAARSQLKEMQSKAEETQAQIASQLSELQSEKELLLTELEQARSQVNEAALQASEAKTQAAVLEILETNLAAAERRNLEKSGKEEQAVKPHLTSEKSPAQTEQKAGLPKPVEELVVGADRETTATNDHENVSVKTEEQPSQIISEFETPSLPAVTEGQVREAVFDNEAQRIIFIRALSDIANQDPAARADAARTIAGIRHELSVRVFAEQMASEPSAQVRHEYIKALTKLQMTEGLGVVERALSDRAALVRLAAVWGLYLLGGAESGPALVRMLSDEDVEVRRRAATCIGWLGQERLAVELLPLLDDSNVSARLAVVEAMGNLGSRQVVTALIEQLNDPEKAVMKAVLGALKTITGKKMSGPFPRDKKSLQCLIARWRDWWKEEQLG